MAIQSVIPFGPQHPVLPEPIHIDLVLEDEEDLKCLQKREISTIINMLLREPAASDRSVTAWHTVRRLKKFLTPKCRKEQNT